MGYEHEDFIIDLADGYSEQALEEVREVYTKAKAFDEVVPFIKEQFVRANQNYGFAKFYGYSNENLKKAEEQLFEKQHVAITVCNALDITLEEFIMLEDTNNE